MFRVTDLGIEPLSRCKSLELLDLTACKYITHIDSILDECRKLKTLAVADCDNIDWSRLMTSLGRYSVNVAKLDLSMSNLDDRALAQLADSAPVSLSHLGIHSCKRVTDVSFVGETAAIRRLLKARSTRFESDGSKFYLMMCDCDGVSREALHALRIDFADLSELKCLHLRCVKDLPGAVGRTCSCSNP